MSDVLAWVSSIADDAPCSNFLPMLSNTLFETSMLSRWVL